MPRERITYHRHHYRLEWGFLVSCGLTHTIEIVRNRFLIKGDCSETHHIIEDEAYQVIYSRLPLLHPPSMNRATPVKVFVLFYQVERRDPKDCRAWKRPMKLLPRGTGELERAILEAQEGSVGETYDR